MPACLAHACARCLRGSYYRATLQLHQRWITRCRWFTLPSQFCQHPTWPTFICYGSQNTHLRAACICATTLLPHTRAPLPATYHIYATPARILRAAHCCARVRNDAPHALLPGQLAGLLDYSRYAYPRTPAFTTTPHARAVLAPRFIAQPAMRAFVPAVHPAHFCVGCWTCALGTRYRAAHMTRVTYTVLRTYRLTSCRTRWFVLADYHPLPLPAMPQPLHTPHALPHYPAIPRRPGRRVTYIYTPTTAVAPHAACRIPGTLHNYACRLPHHTAHAITTFALPAALHALLPRFYALLRLPRARTCTRHARPARCRVW